MTNIQIGERIFFTYRNDYGGKTQASGVVLGIRRPMGQKGPEQFTVGCDTPGVWIGTREPNSNRRIVQVPESALWRLK